jgi:REP element-mobilizing transposase RayT
MTATRYKIYDNDYPHFLTCSVVGWLPVFTRPAAVQIVLDSLTFLQQERRLTLFAYVIMENHLHLIASAEDLAVQVANFKSYTARQILDHLVACRDSLILKQLEFHKQKYKTDREYQFWQEGSHPQQIDSDAIMLQKIEYIHCNPLKRGYIDDPVHWRYSSARNYAGLPGLIDVTTEW